MAVKLRCPACGQPEGILVVWGFPLPLAPESYAGHQFRVVFNPTPGDLGADGRLPDTECQSCGQRWLSGLWKLREHMGASKQPLVTADPLMTSAGRAGPGRRRMG